MSDWTYYRDETPVDLNSVKRGEQYFYIHDDIGRSSGLVTVLSVDKRGITVEYIDGLNSGYTKNKIKDVILPGETQKKLFEIKTVGGKRSRRHNKKYNKTKKSRRKSNRRKR